MNNLFNILLFSGYALCSGSGLIILKSAMSAKADKSLTLFQTFLQVRFIAGFLLYAAGFLLWMLILSRFKLNVAFPVAMSLFFIVSGLGSAFILKESFSVVQIVGIALCLAGILLIHLSN
jgi:drug/metabolite transporter (DMT)-like permease